MGWKRVDDDGAAADADDGAMATMTTMATIEAELCVCLIRRKDVKRALPGFAVRKCAAFGSFGSRVRMRNLPGLIKRHTGRRQRQQRWVLPHTTEAPKHHRQQAMGRSLLCAMRLPREKGEKRAQKRGRKACCSRRTTRERGARLIYGEHGWAVDEVPVPSGAGLSVLHGGAKALAHTLCVDWCADARRSDYLRCSVHTDRHSTHRPTTASRSLAHARLLQSAGPVRSLRLRLRRGSVPIYEEV
uniref:Uncharacterized protein n=1 Tax=Anopheles farauti TaxID=69004 RepID=A0A182QSB5_9DIPT